MHTRKRLCHAPRRQLWAFSLTLIVAFLCAHEGRNFIHLIGIYQGWDQG